MINSESASYEVDNIPYFISLKKKRKISNLAKKNTLVSGHASDEKNLPLGGSKLIFFN